MFADKPWTPEHQTLSLGETKVARPEPRRLVHNPTGLTRDPGQRCPVCGDLEIRRAVEPGSDPVYQCAKCCSWFEADCGCGEPSIEPSIEPPESAPGGTPEQDAWNVLVEMYGQHCSGRQDLHMAALAEYRDAIVNAAVTRYNILWSAQLEDKDKAWAGAVEEAKVDAVSSLLEKVAAVLERASASDDQESG